MAKTQVDRHPSDGRAILAFASREAFEAWLDAHHADEPGLWVKIAKKGRGIASVSIAEAIEVALCFGWIDSKMHGLDDDYYLQRIQPRKPKSTWSARNQEIVERLVAEGRMRPAGLAHVEAAKADGRWDTA
jgi:uncharacterized protein YdeI (YjbR/CyaY-like superfamily)